MSYRGKLFENLVKKSEDDKVAIYNKSHNFTYKELREDILNISQQIVNVFGPENEVFSVRMENIVDSFRAILGLIFANKTILPIPLEVPEDKAMKSISEVGPVAIFTDTLDCYEDGVNFKNFIKKDSDTHFDPLPYHDESKFIIIMTSGTTGTPKGCCLQDKSFLGRINYLQKKFGFNNSDNFLFSSNYSFDVSYTQILTWLFGLGSITIQEKGEDYRSIPSYVKDYDVTHLALSPAVLKTIYDSLVVETKSLKNVFVAGEKFPKIIAEKYAKNNAYFALWNMYGPTEFSIYATFFDISEYKHEDTSVPLGYPLDNVKLKILDRNYNPIDKENIEGQIALGGKGIFLEYLNDAEKTRKAIKKIDGINYYLTGDLGCFLEDKVYFGGRKDHQLKINGIRVEAEDIEKSILEHCDKIQNTIISQVEFQGKNRLVSFFVSRNGSDIPPVEIRDAIKPYMEKYFIPRFFIKVNEIPLNKNGKVDLEKLNQLYIDMRENKKTTVTIKNNDNPKEVLKEIWERILNIRVKNNDNFFNLGADSLDTIMLLVEVKDRFGVDLAVEDIYSYPLIKDQIRLIFSKSSNDIFEKINQKIVQTYTGVYLSKEKIYGKTSIVLHSEQNYDPKEVIQYINDNYSMEFVPNYVVVSNSQINEIDGDEFFTDSLRNPYTASALNEKMLFQISKNLDEIDASTMKSSEEPYMCGPGQNKIFIKHYNDLVVNVTTIKSISTKLVFKALNNVVNKQAMLRSKIFEDNGKYYFQEYDIKKDFEISVLDITKYGFIDKDKIVESATNELFNYVAKMKKVGNFLYRLLLLKEDEKTFKLITVFSHLIADAASSNIFTKACVSEVRNLEMKQEGENDTQEEKNVLKSYKDYLNELTNNSSQAKYFQYINGEKYNEVKRWSGGFERRRNLNSQIIKVPINKLKKSILNSSDDKEGLLLWLTSVLANILLEKEKITFRITNNGRKLSECNFSSVIGDCHVHYPLIIDIQKDNALTCAEKLVSEYRYYYGENKIYLENLCYGQEGEKNNLIQNLYDELDFVFNYIGEMSSQESEQYCKNVLLDTTVFKTFYVYCYTTKKDLVLNCRLPIERQKKIVERFTETVLDK